MANDRTSRVYVNMILQACSTYNAAPGATPSVSISYTRLLHMTNKLTAWRGDPEFDICHAGWFRQRELGPYLVGSRRRSPARSRSRSMQQRRRLLNYPRPAPLNRSAVIKEPASADRRSVEEIMDRRRRQCCCMTPPQSSSGCGLQSNQRVNKVKSEREEKQKKNQDAALSPTPRRASHRRFRRRQSPTESREKECVKYSLFFAP